MYCGVILVGYFRVGAVFDDILEGFPCAAGAGLLEKGVNETSGVFPLLLVALRVAGADACYGGLAAMALLGVEDDLEVRTHFRRLDSDGAEEGGKVH